jgi:hypothetical protein
MKPNIGTADKFIRILAATVIASLFLTHHLIGFLPIILVVFIGVFLLTSLTGFCPLYVPFGISTRRKIK